MIFFYIYLIGCLLVAMWFGFFMTKLDRFDWAYNKSDIWFSYGLSILLWPLMLLKPANLFQGVEFFRDSGLLDLAARARDLHQVMEKPPPCGQTIHFVYKGEFDKDAPVSMYFDADQLVEHYKGKELPLYHGYEPQAFVSWIKSRDPRINVTDVPSLFNFEDMAFQMINAGIGAIECPQCDKQYNSSELVLSNESIRTGRSSYGYEIFSCPEGHELARHNNLHILHK